MDRGKSDAAVVINDHEDILPAGAGRVLAAVAGHPVAGTAEAAKVLDIQMQHVARGLVLVAVVGPRRIEMTEAMEAGGLDQARHGAHAYAQCPGDLAVGLALPAPGEHLPDERQRGDMGTAAKASATVLQARGSSLAEPLEPLVDGAGTDIHGLSNLGRSKAFFQHAFH